jgi:hypothetical protein
MITHATKRPPSSEPQAPASENGSTTSTEFEQQAADDEVGLVREFIDFMAHHKKWWLSPIILLLLLVALLVLAGSSGAAPFIYTLF